jgi:hypothetical protein
MCIIYAYPGRSVYVALVVYGPADSARVGSGPREFK